MEALQVKAPQNKILQHVSLLLPSSSSHRWRRNFSFLFDFL